MFIRCNATYHNDNCTDGEIAPEATCRTCGLVWHSDTTTILNLNWDYVEVSAMGFWSNWVETINFDECGLSNIPHPESCPVCDPEGWYD